MIFMWFIVLYLLNVQYQWYPTQIINLSVDTQVLCGFLLMLMGVIEISVGKIVEAIKGE